MKICLGAWGVWGMSTTDMDKSVVPIQHVPRSVPVAMKELLKQKLTET